MRYSIPEYIKNNNELKKHIIDIKEAEVKDGGSGAFYIYLKNNYIFKYDFVANILKVEIHW